MKQTAYNPYGLRETKKEAAFKKLARLAIWGGNGGRVFLYVFVYQLLEANLSAVSTVKDILLTVVRYLAECLSIASLFIVLGLLITATVREDYAHRKKLLLAETLSLFSLSVFARILLFWLTALIDSAELFGGFHFNDMPLASIDLSVLIETLTSALFGVILLLAILLVSSWLLGKLYRQGERGKPTERMIKLPILIYLAVSVGFAITETVFSLIDIGISLDFSVIFSLLIPYIEIAVYTLIGRYLISATAMQFDKKE